MGGPKGAGSFSDFQETGLNYPITRCVYKTPKSGAAILGRGKSLLAFGFRKRSYLEVSGLDGICSRTPDKSPESRFRIVRSRKAAFESGDVAPAALECLISIWVDEDPVKAFGKRGNQVFL